MGFVHSVEVSQTSVNYVIDDSTGSIIVRRYTEQDDDSMSNMANIR